MGIITLKQGSAWSFLWRPPFHSIPITLVIHIFFRTILLANCHQLCFITLEADNLFIHFHFVVTEAYLDNLCDWYIWEHMVLLVLVVDIYHHHIYVSLLLIFMLHWKQIVSYINLHIGQRI